MMTLKEFLKEMGDEAASDLLDVPPRTVAAWRRGERLPRPIQAARIVLASKGVVDYAGIYAPAPDAPDENGLMLKCRCCIPHEQRRQ